jgi:diacylglycerol kinase family enzyme
LPAVLIFFNPISGRGRGKQLAHRLERRLAVEGFATRVFSERPDHIAFERLPPDPAAGIVIGGDGTLRAVASGFLQSSLSNPVPPLLLLPMGTANLMGKHLGLNWQNDHVEEQVLTALRNHRIVKLDTATANGQLMLLVAGVGLDAQVVHELDKRRRGPISYLSYAVPVLSALGRFNYPPLEVTVDDRRIFEHAPAIVFIGNVPEYGTGFPILPMASPTDGLLDVCVLPCRSREELFAHIFRAAAGEHLHGEGVIYSQGRRIRVESEVPVPVQVDGEAAGFTPLLIDLLPTRLAFIVGS